MLCTFPTLDSAEKALLTEGRKIEAVKAYYFRAQVTLLNGKVVGPNLRTAKSIVELSAMGLDIPTAVSEGSFRDLTGLAERAQLISERFTLFCVEDGLDPKNPRKACNHSSCDVCGKKASNGETLDGVMLYAPDGLGYPTPVLFACTNCKV